MKFSLLNNFSVHQRLILPLLRGATAVVRLLALKLVVLALALALGRPLGPACGARGYMPVKAL